MKPRLDATSGVPKSEVKPGGVGASSRGAVALTLPAASGHTGNFEPDVALPQVTTPSLGSGIQIPSVLAQFVRFAASTAWSWLICEVEPARATSMTSSGGRWNAIVTGHALRSETKTTESRTLVSARASTSQHPALGNVTPLAW